MARLLRRGLGSVATAGIGQLHRLVAPEIAGLIVSIFRRVDSSYVEVVPLCQDSLPLPFAEGTGAGREGLLRDIVVGDHPVGVVEIIAGGELEGSVDCEVSPGHHSGIGRIVDLRDRAAFDILEHIARLRRHGHGDGIALIGVLGGDAQAPVDRRVDICVDMVQLRGRRIIDQEMSAVEGGVALGHRAEIDGLVPRVGGVHHVVAHIVREPLYDGAVLHLYGLELVPHTERAQENPLHAGVRIVGLPGEAIFLGGRPAIHGAHQEKAGEPIVLGLVRGRGGLRFSGLRRALRLLRQGRCRQQGEEHQQRQQRGQQAFCTHKKTSFVLSRRRHAREERNRILREFLISYPSAFANRMRKSIKKL